MAKFKGAQDGRTTVFVPGHGQINLGRDGADVGNRDAVAALRSYSGVDEVKPPAKKKD